MEIKVRYLKSDIVNKVDKLAKLNMESRNEFLLKKIEEIAFEKESNQLEEYYTSLIESLIEVTKNHTKVLGSFMDQFIIDGKDACNMDLNYNEIKNKINPQGIKLHFGEETTVIKINNIPINVVARVDEICKERKVSRNEFLNMYISQLTYSNSLKLINEKYEYMAEKTLGLLEFSNRVLALFYEENCIDTSNFYEGDNL